MEGAGERVAEGRRLQPGKGGGGGNAGLAQALATVAVSAATEVACDLPVFRAGRPCYLADLRSATVSKTATVTLGPVPNINGAPFSSPTGYDAATQMEVGTVNQLNLNGVNAHPFHLHINPYQIVADPANTHMGYFRAGDWHDVLMSGNNAVAVRLQTDTFVGKQVTTAALPRSHTGCHANPNANPPLIPPTTI